MFNSCGTTIGGKTQGFPSYGAPQVFFDNLVRHTGRCQSGQLEQSVKLPGLPPYGGSNPPLPTTL